MHTRPFASIRRMLLAGTACALSVGIYTGWPAGLTDALGKVGNEAQFPLETLAIEQIADDPGNAASAARQVPAASLWRSRDSSALRRDVGATHERAPGFVHSIRFEDFKHWT